MNITTTRKEELLKRVFLHNSREKLLSALCTILVIFVALCFKPIYKVYTLKVNTKIAENQVIVSENIDTVKVKVKGNFFELKKVKSEDLVISFDFSTEKAGEIARNIGNNDLPLSFAALDIQNVSPQMLTLITEEKKRYSAPVDSPAEANVVHESEKEKVNGEVPASEKNEEIPEKATEKSESKESNE